MSFVASFLALLIGACGYAAWKGGAPERWCAGLLFGAVLTSNGVMLATSRHFASTEVGAMMVDLALTVGLIALALRADRFWPLIIAATQVDRLLIHLVMFSGHAMPFAYALMLRLFDLPAPILLAVGVWRHQRRCQIPGAEAAWSTGRKTHERLRADQGRR